MSLCFSRLVLASEESQSRLSLALLPVSSVSRLSSLSSDLCARHRMCFKRFTYSVRAVLRFLGRMLLLCLVVDTLFLACLHDAALIPSLLANGSDSGGAWPALDSLPSAPSDVSLQHPPSSHSAASSSLVSQSAAERIQLPPAALTSRPSSWSSSSASSSSSSDTIHSNLSDTNSTLSLPGLNHQQPNNSDGSPATNTSSGGAGDGGGHKQAVSSHRAGVPGKEFPLALVVASSSVAVSILLFFCLSYIWHTRQLDRRAQKLAIRLAAESDGDVDCSQCRTPTTYMAGSSQDSGTDSGGEELSPLPALPAHDELNSLNEEDEEEAGAEDGVAGGGEGRRKPGGVGRTLGSRRGSRGRGRRSGSRSSRKWSGHSGQTRSSLVTDQEILNHFASRRHSTFFI